MNEIRIVLSTFPSQEIAAQIAKTLVEVRLAACVNIVPGLSSVYSWEGALNTDPEVLLLIKTAAEKVSALEARLKELHPYKLPEFVVLEACQVSAAYAEWVRQSVKP
jgi:periplasmic divalent cation tolerance protein